MDAEYIQQHWERREALYADLLSRMDEIVRSQNVLGGNLQKCLVGIDRLSSLGVREAWHAYFVAWMGDPPPLQKLVVLGQKLRQAVEQEMSTRPPYSQLESERGARSASTVQGSVTGSM